MVEEEKKYTLNNGNMIQPKKKIRLGICAMGRKLRSHPMQEIHYRIKAYHSIEFVWIDESVMKLGVEEWPRVDVLISRYSSGFPYEKSVAYCKLRKPHLINDVESQRILFDRREVYRILDECKIPTSRHVVYTHTDPSHRLNEYEDFIVVNGIRIEKPFVEKPVSGNDHAVFIYYSKAQGGGSRRLFRKIGNKSSEFHDVDTIRKGSFVYEEMIPGGRDIKVYTVGEDYSHAEIRKSPWVDGFVQRDCFGKEIRRAIRLTDEEREICRKVVRAFKQQICGFDLLRDRRNRPYVIDVNGWSFVKNNRKYYDDCARIIKEMCQKFDRVNQPYFFSQKIQRPCLKGNAVVDSKQRILRGVFAIFRHGDRTPKQKLKVKTSNKTLVKFLDGFLVSTELKIHYSTNRKLFAEATEVIGSVLKNDRLSRKEHKILKDMHHVMQMKHLGLKFQMKNIRNNRNGDLQLEKTIRVILKWGGELTEAGFKQAHSYAQQFKDRFIETNAAESKKFMKGLKVYTTDEQRVLYTAKAFLKSLLLLSKDEEIPDNVLQAGSEVQFMLDGNSASTAKKLINDSKAHIAEIIQLKSVDFLISDSDDDLSLEQDVKESSVVKSKLLPWAKRCLKVLDNPQHCCRIVAKQIKDLLSALRKTQSLQDPRISSYQNEAFADMICRWSKLYDEFHDQEHDEFAANKIPDIFDSVRYDLLYNANCLGLSYEQMDRLWQSIDDLAAFVIPQEYGFTREDKQNISRNIAERFFTDLKEKINSVLKDEDTSRMFLYFSSESHLHALRNALIMCKTPLNKTVEKNVEGIELSYLAHCVIRIFEDPTKHPQSPDRFFVSVHISPGAHGNPLNIVKKCDEGGSLVPIEIPSCLNNHLPLPELFELLNFSYKN